MAKDIDASNDAAAGASASNDAAANADMATPLQPTADTADTSLQPAAEAVAAGAGTSLQPAAEVVASEVTTQPLPVTPAAPTPAPQLISYEQWCGFANPPVEAASALLGWLRRKGESDGSRPDSEWVATFERFMNSTPDL